MLDGIIVGRTALSIFVWTGGTLLLVAAAILIFSNRRTGRTGVITYGLACVLFVISTMLQYGPLFKGPAGVAIPIGLPLLVVIGNFLWKDAAVTGTADERDDDLSEEDDAPLLTAPAGADSGADD